MSTDNDELKCLKGECMLLELKKFEVMRVTRQTLEHEEWYLIALAGSDGKVRNFLLDNSQRDELVMALQRVPDKEPKAK
jgi:hypothetical protein